MLARGNDTSQSQSNGNFLKIKPNLKPKLLQFMDILTSMALVWKKLRRSYDPWEPARWNLSFPKASVQGHDPCRNPRQGQELLSILLLLSRQIQSPLLLSLLKGSPCCAQQEFHCWPQKLGHSFASKCICLFLYENRMAAYCLLTSLLCSTQPLRLGPHKVLSI